MMDSKRRGYSAEDYSEKLLIKKGYKILKRNFYTPFSEIDIIALDSKELVFVEVKARWSAKFGKPEEAVNSKKLERIRKAGEYYCLKNPGLPKKARIEVISLILKNNSVISEKLIKVY
jgi:putative endonuclease